MGWDDINQIVKLVGGVMFVSLFVIALGAMSIQEVNNDTSDDYSNAVKVVAGLTISMGALLIIGWPFYLGLEGSQLWVSLAAILLVFYLLALAGMALYATTTEDLSDTFDKALLGVAGAGIALACLMVIGMIVFVSRSDDPEGILKNWLY